MKGMISMNHNDEGKNEHNGQDPQPQHGNDNKGHKDNDGGIVSRPGKSHSLSQ